MTSKRKLNFIDLELEKFKQNNTYRKLKYSTSQGSHITINGKKLLNLCSNDYLGIPITKMQTTQLQSSSRLVSGNDNSYKNFKEILKSEKSCDKALSAGYDIGIGVTDGAALRNEELDKDLIDWFDETYDRSFKILKSRGFSDSEAKEILGRLFMKEI